MGLLEDLSSGKYNLVLFAIIFILMFHQYWCKSYSITKSINQCKDKKESMTNVSNDINAAISRIYKADVEAIRNLADLSKKIQEEGLTIPGNLTVGGTFNYLPKGSIIAYNQISAPKGWAICDGNNSTPDLRGRFIFGNGGSRGMNTTGGVETVTLLESHMPSHTHTANINDPGHEHYLVEGAGTGHGVWWGVNGGQGRPHPRTNKAKTDITVNIEQKGGNQPHENMPPFYVLTYIMKL
jgi:microcystin-dependent protein